MYSFGARVCVKCIQHLRYEREVFLIIKRSIKRRCGGVTTRRFRFFETNYIYVLSK